MPVDDTLRALAHPARRAMLKLVWDVERSSSELAEAVAMTRPAASQHLKVLRDAGLVQVRQDAQRRWYRLRPEPLAEVDAWLAPYRALWAASFDALERHLDADPLERR